MSWMTRPPTPKLSNTIALTPNTMRLKKKWPCYGPDSPSTTKPSMVAGIESRRVESHICSATYRGGPTSPCARESSWEDTWEANPEGLLGQESQSDKRVMSPPKHMVKLPYWSSPWYHQYCRDLAHHIYVSYVSSLIAHLPSPSTPHFGSEAKLDVLYFLSLPCGCICHP